MRFPRSQVLAVLLLLSGTTPAVRALDPDLALTQYVREAWDTNDGLPQNTVKAITQTRDGYLWLGTEEGLARFDGIRFVVFDSANTPELVSDHVQALFEDGRGNLWIATRDGLVRLRGGVFERFDERWGLTDPDVLDVLVDASGALWVATQSALFHGDESRIEPYSGPGGEAIHEVRSINPAPDGGLWFETKDTVFELRGDVWRSRDITPYVRPPRPTSAGRPDSAGRLWIGGSGKVCRLDAEYVACLDDQGQLDDAVVSALLPDSQGALWIGTLAEGLRREVDGRWDRLTSEDELARDRVAALFEDREGSLWIGTAGGGLVRLRQGKFVTYGVPEGLGSDFVHSVYEDSGGTLWIGTGGGGLGRLRDGRIENFTGRDGLLHDDVLTTVEDADGILWIGTGRGLCRRAAGGGIRCFDSDDGFPRTIVFSSALDPRGGVLFGSPGQVTRLADGVFAPLVRLRPAAPPVALAWDPGGDLWIGIFGAGVKRWSPDGAETDFNRKNGLPTDDVIALHVDRAGVVWIGTHGGGLARLENGTVTSFSRRNGLPGDVVYQVLEDDAGNLWMGGNQGIFRVDKRELNAVAAGEADSIHAVTYGSADGMRSAECNGGQQPAGWHGRDGRLWFPTVAGVASIDPARLVLNTEPPPVHIEEVSVNDVRVALTSADAAGTLARAGDNLQLRYTANSLVAPERNRFLYRLEGFEDEWVEAGGRRQAFYTNLPPGAYRFRVKACNADGVWNEEGASFAFRVAPHLYQTWWFYGLCVVAGGFGLLAAHRLRVRHLEARERRLAAVVEERTRDLSEAKRALEESNLTLERRVREGIDALRDAERMAAYGNMVASVAHEVRHPIFSLQAAAYVLGDKLRGQEGIEPQLRVLDRETKRMGDLMTDLLEFARPGELNVADVDPRALLEEAAATFPEVGGEAAPGVRIHCEEGLPPVRVDHRRMLQVFLNLMENARRHAEGANVVTLEARACPAERADGSRTLTFRVIDDGRGIPEDRLPHIFEPFYTSGRGTGLGLAIVRRIVTEHGGTIRVDSTPGGGTTFTIALPL